MPVGLCTYLANITPGKVQYLCDIPIKLVDLSYTIVSVIENQM